MEEIYQRLKKQLIDFGKRTGLIVYPSLMSRSIYAIMRDLHEEETGSEASEQERKKLKEQIPDEIVEEFTNRFIKEMEYVTYYDKAVISKTDQDYVYNSAKALIKQNVLSNSVMILFKRKLYVDKLVAVMVKLNSGT